MVAVGHKTPEAGLTGSPEGVPEPELGPEAAVLAVMHVPGHDDEIHRLIDGQLDDPVKGRERRLPEHRGNGGRRRVDPLEGAVQVQVGAMHKAERPESRHGDPVEESGWSPPGGSAADPRLPRGRVK